MPFRRRAPVAPPLGRRLSISPDEVVLQNERTRGSLLEEEAAVTVSQVDLNDTLVPQIRALLSKQS